VIPRSARAARLYNALKFVGIFGSAIAFTFNEQAATILRLERTVDKDEDITNLLSRQF
jgi:hypothetical protein